MSGKIGSLNVSVASGILLYEIANSGTGRIISLEYKTVRIKEALKKQVSDFALRITIG